MFNPKYKCYKGGYTAGPKEIVDLLRQRSRPYLFSNTLAPSIVGASIAVLDILEKSTELRDKLEANTLYFRQKMTEAGFDIKMDSKPSIVTAKSRSVYRSYIQPIRKLI